MALAAALPPSRSSPTLPLLPLLLLLLLLRETGAQDVQVRVPPEVRGYLGSTVQLPCHLLPPGPEVRVSQVTWLHVDAAGVSKSVAAFHPSYGPSFRSPKPGEERLSFVTAGQSAGTRQGTEMDLRDATLALRGLTVDDEGNYTCEFATFPSGTSRGVTWLKAIAQPQNHAETQEVTLSLDPVPVARCVSEGGRPPARISWFSPLDGETKETQMSGPVPGTVTVTSRFTLVPLSRADGVKVTCKVEHESFEEPILLPVTLSVRYPPEVSISGYDDNWYLGRSEATLSCDVRSKPEPTGYDWSTTAGVFPASAVAQGPQLIIHSVDRLVNTTFICTVTNAVGTGRAEQVVLVRDTPRGGPAPSTLPRPAGKPTPEPLPQIHTQEPGLPRHSHQDTPVRGRALNTQMQSYLRVTGGIHTHKHTDTPHSPLKHTEIPGTSPARNHPLQENTAASKLSPSNTALRETQPYGKTPRLCREPDAGRDPRTPGS
ncbi:nectin-2 isoform X3 [Mustela erminea]|uniref:nectin-2 isoform X3 n=1 Tax=Mustela erminea TaxID=36723 RepID=UPI001386BA4A|nr:nectin-2 isoform X3 [Mustela erminea]